MKRRIIAGVLVSVLALTTLAGCGNSNTEKTSAGTSSAKESGSDNEATGAEQSLTMILSQRDEWLSEMEAGAVSQAKEVGVKLNTVDAQSDTSKMLQFIETAKNDGQEAIIINMVDPETAPQCVEAAGDMKVIFVNRYPSDPSVLNENVVYVGSDEHTSGKFQGEWLAKYFKDKGKTDIKYILLNGILGQTSTSLRTESVMKALKDNGINATEATAPLACDFDRASAQDMITPLLNTTEYDCIISNNDAMALGVVEAMKSQNIDPKEKPIVGIDASVDGRQGVKDGTIAMTVFQDAKGQGKGSMIAAKNLIEGKAINDGSELQLDETGNILWIPFEPVTAENVADYDNR